MSKDIRISTDFSRNFKRKKLRQMLGSDAVVALLDLWLFAGERRTEGVLTDMDEGDIALACDYTGDPARFVQVLVDVGFLDPVDGVYVLHDWEDHNPWAAGEASRVKAAKTAATKKWEKVNAAKAGTSCRSDADRMRDAQNRTAPSPSPSPKPDPMPDPDPTQAGASEPSIIADSLREDRESASEQTRVLEDEAGAEGVGAAADGWIFSPEDVAALAAATEGLAIAPEELPAAIGGAIYKRAALQPGQPKAIEPAVHAAWCALDADQVTAWSVAALKAARRRAAGDLGVHWLALAAGCVIQALQQHYDLPKAEGVTVLAAAPVAVAAATGWRSWLERQGRLEHEAFVVRQVADARKAGYAIDAARYMSLFQVARDAALQEAGVKPGDRPGRVAAEARARDLCLEELERELAELAGLPAAGGAL